MLAKIWKKLFILIAITACLFNIMGKFVDKLGFIEELKSATHVISTEKVDNK